MAIKNTIECPRCQAIVYSGLSAPEAGSYIDCKSCGYTVSIKADNELPVPTLPPAAPPAPPAAPPAPPTAPLAPPAPTPANDDKEAGLETLAPIEEIPAPTPASPATSAMTAVKTPAKTTFETFKFTGTAGEYFKIWIVNIALSIITLGIYSPWAKVRNNRYFYGNTRLMGSAFEYHADPKKILKGRVLVFALFGLSNLLNNFVPIAGGIFSIALVFIIPWFVIKSMKFRARNSSYRNIRFNFESDYGESLATFVGYGILAAVTLGIGYPHFVFKRKEFTIGNSRYGTTPFKFTAGSRQYYKIYLKALGLLILMIACSIGSMVAIAFIPAIFTKGIPSPGFSAIPVPLITMLPMIFMALFYFFIFAFLKTRVDNLSLSSASIGKSRLESTMRVRDMAWIYISNAALIIVTLGLMTPWAKIRSKRYKIEHLHLHVGEDIDAFIAEEAKETSTFGEEALDFLDFDIGL